MQKVTVNPSIQLFIKNLIQTSHTLVTRYFGKTDFAGHNQDFTFIPQQHIQSDMSQKNFENNFIDFA